MARQGFIRGEVEVQDIPLYLTSTGLVYPNSIPTGDRSADPLEGNLDSGDDRNP